MIPRAVRIEQRIAELFSWLVEQNVPGLKFDMRTGSTWRLLARAVAQSVAEGMDQEGNAS